ncbi:hypothetical protein K505DRAFT_369987 [Melanomma pulvis-pyrius CBS 109.77]|uniref:HAUS augmin-like complex subunit 1 n=1 Tax=Melanomma pulvis-pyrius CBS 109.77 TaxID=1314802 RepID=A0A6A6XX33_9PLEO|nr:hypothetical protein K505DRAFT_369987 [Melanomma pulvis-pyrius CBS 109.77]
MDALTPSDLFSPSKARQQRAQAQDWAHIDSWLSYKYSGRTIPTFERNDETLKVLRELSMANERADEERAIQEKLEREALREVEADECAIHPSDVDIFATLTSSLTLAGTASLYALASTTLSLQASTPSPETLAHALIHHTSVSQTLSNQLAHIQTLQSYLEKQHTLLRTVLQDLQSNPAFAPPSTLQRQTADQVRQTKHLRTKIKECEDKLSSLQLAQTQTQNQGQRRNTLTSSNTPKGADVGSAEAIAQMLEQQQGLEELRTRVEALERDVREFGGLPADRESARKEVGRLEVEMDKVRRARDVLFEGLVG